MLMKLGELLQSRLEDRGKVNFCPSCSMCPALPLASPSGYAYVQSCSKEAVLSHFQELTCTEREGGGDTYFVAPVLATLCREQKQAPSAEL